MRFFKTLSSSIYSPSFYAEVAKKPFFSALKYFLLLVLLLSVIQAASKSKFFFGSMPQVVGNFVKNVQEIYPQDLVMEIKSGQAKINQPEPYFLPIPNSAQSFFQKAGFENILVVDTKTPFSIDQFYKYKTAIWLMKDKIATKEKGGSGQVKLSDLSQVQQDITINRAMVDNVFAKLAPYIDSIVKYGGPVLFILFIIGLFIVHLFRLLYLLILAIVIYIIGKAVKFNLTYGEAYIVGMYAMTLALIISVVFFALGGFFQLSMPKYLFSVLTLVVATVNLTGAKKLKE